MAGFPNWSKDKYIPVLLKENYTNIGDNNNKLPNTNLLESNYDKKKRNFISFFTCSKTSNKKITS